MAWYKPSLGNVSQGLLAPMTLGMDKLLGGGSKETTTATSPWGPQQPYLKDIYGQASALNAAGQGFNPYTGERYAGLDPLQTQGMGMIQNAVQGGNTSVQNAESMLNQTAQGGYLGANPYLDQVYNTAANRGMQTFQNQVMPQIKAGAQGAGMGASSRNALAQGQAAGQMGQGLLDLAGQVYAPAYETERNRQMQAAQIAPTTANWGANQLMGLGAINQGMAQQQLQGQQDVYNQQQQAPWQRLQAFQGAMGGNAGGTTTQSGAGGGLLGGLGGAATGGALGGMLPTAFMAENPYMWPLLIGGGALAGSR